MNLSDFSVFKFGLTINNWTLVQVLWLSTRALVNKRIGGQTVGTCIPFHSSGAVVQTVDVLLRLKQMLYYIY